MFRHITCHPQGALMFLAKITGKTICKTWTYIVWRVWQHSLNSRVHACSVCYCAWWYVDRLWLESVSILCWIFWNHEIAYLLDIWASIELLRFQHFWFVGCTAGDLSVVFRDGLSYRDPVIIPQSTPSESSHAAFLACEEMPHRR
jgi:hypothetical protein